MANDMLTLADVAARLGISTRRVQALVTSGQLPAERVGRQWLVSLASVQRRDRTVVTQPGRPLSAAGAWRQIVQLPHNLVGGNNRDAVRRRLLPRAQHRNMWVHPGLIADVRERNDIFLGGRDAADQAGLPVGGEPEIDVYLAASQADAFIESIAARNELSAPNLFLHVVDDASFEILKSRSEDLLLAVAWLDLADRDDRASSLVLARLLAVGA